MNITVSINKDTREKFFQPIFDIYPNFENQILRDFKKYKESYFEPIRKVPNYFGQDVAYTQPHLANQIGLMHIHLCLPPHEFNKNKPQMDRKCKPGENDTSLVYIQGYDDQNAYSLLAILSPDAHDKARDEKLMNYICRAGKDFYDNN